MAIWHEERLLIDGQLVEAEGGKTYETISPSTEEVLGVAADASLDDVRRAIAAARRAFDTTDWSRNRELRLDLLRKYHAALVAKIEDLRAIVVQEVGAPVQITAGAALETPVSTIPYFANVLEGYEFTEELSTVEFYGNKSRRWVEKESVGVVAAITAYNYPIQLALAKIIPALAAGCTVVLKGAPQTPWATLALGAIAAEVGFPPGVINVITSSSNEVAAELTTHADVDLVTFTGSTPVGKKIMAAASGTVKRVFLELGGKSAYVVLDDGDINRAAMMCGMAVISHSGQGCAITSRLLVPRAKLDEAVAAVKGVLSSVKYGDPSNPENRMGPLITEDQREKVDGYVKQAVADGATVVLGGKPAEQFEKGFFYEPTIVVGADENSAIAQDELFGPVLVVLPHDGDDDAVRIANNSVFGLSGAVETADLERGIAVARRIRTGTIGVNGGMWFGEDVPFGGFKQSGFGRENGVAGFEEFLEGKSIAAPVA